MTGNALAHITTTATPAPSAHPEVSWVFETAVGIMWLTLSSAG